MDFYTSIAPYYDEIFPYDGVTLDFILRSLKHDKTDQMTDSILALSGRYLDLGCATGELALQAEPFFESVDALDLDPELIKKAKHKRDLLEAEVQNKIQFLTQDIQNIALVFKNKKFDAVSCFGNTLPHLKSPELLQGFFTQVKNILRLGASFSFQIINYDRILSGNIKSLPLVERENVHFERYYSNAKENGCLDFRTILEVKANKKKIENTVELFPYKSTDLKKYLTLAGFSEINFYGSFDRKPFTEDSYLLVCEAR